MGAGQPFQVSRCSCRAWVSSGSRKSSEPLVLSCSWSELRCCRRVRTPPTARVRRRAGTRTKHPPAARRPGRSAHPANRRVCWVNRRCSARRIARTIHVGMPSAQGGGAPATPWGSCPARASRVPPRPAAVRRCSRARRTGPGGAGTRPGPAGSRPSCCHRRTGCACHSPPGSSHWPPKHPSMAVLPRCPRPRLPGRSRPGAPAGRCRGCRPAASRPRAAPGPGAGRLARMFHDAVGRVGYRDCVGSADEGVCRGVRERPACRVGLVSEVLVVG